MFELTCRLGGRRRGCTSQEKSSRWSQWNLWKWEGLVWIGNKVSPSQGAGQSALALIKFSPRETNALVRSWTRHFPRGYHRKGILKFFCNSSLTPATDSFSTTITSPFENQPKWVTPPACARALAYVQSIWVVDHEGSFLMERY